MTMPRDFTPESYGHGPQTAKPQLLNPAYLQDTFSDLPHYHWPEQWQPSADFPTPQSANRDEFSQIANDAVSFGREPVLYRLGEANLPVAPYREHFLKVVAENQRVVVSSETGSGKSSQLGLYLLEAGAPRVFVTQPRIFAASELKDRARQNLGPDHDKLAGYLTGNAADSDCGPDARLIYVTEQLLFKMVNRGNIDPNDVIILDEAHERTTAMVLLMGLLKGIQPTYPDLRLIVSSATIDTSRFAQYLADPQTGEPAPVLILPGRTHPIKRLDSDENVARTMRRHMVAGHNVLAFEPGVQRMRSTSAQARSRKKTHTVHELYGDQSPSEQKAALTSEDRHHVVATRIGETSITPEGKDVVVDSGLSNVGQYNQGVRRLVTVFSSKDTMLQRSGRVGRTKPGIYELAVPDDTPPPPEYEDRPDYESPSIQNSSVTSYIAELQGQGRRLEDLDLFEDPTTENLRHDYLVLQRLGALALVSDQVVLTEVGHAMNDLPLDASLARMVVEARGLGDGISEEELGALRLQVVAAAAVQQVKGILDAAQNGMHHPGRRKNPKESLSDEQSSNVLFELDVFASMFDRQQEMLTSDGSNVTARFEAMLTENGILVNRYYKAVRTYEELCRRENLDPLRLEKPSDKQRSLILDCQVTGAEEVFVRRSKTLFVDIRGGRRTLGRRSNIAAPMAQLVMGTAFDLDGLRASGRSPRYFISGASAVSLEQLRAKVPHRLSERSAGHAISSKGELVERKTYFFDGELNVGELEGTLAPTLAAREAILTAMMTGTGSSTANEHNAVPYNPGTPNAIEAAKQWKQAQKLEHRSPANLNVAKRYASLIKRVVRESLETIPLDVTDPVELDALIPKVYVNGLVRPSRRKDIPVIVRKSPDGIAIHVDAETKEYIPVNYKNNIAYVTLTRDQSFTMSRSDFTELLEQHDIKLRVGAGKYLQFDAALEKLEEQRVARDVKRAKRDLQRTLDDARALESGVPIKGLRRPVKEPRKEASAKAANSRSLTSRQRRGMGRRLRINGHEADD